MSGIQINFQKIDEEDELVQQTTLMQEGQDWISNPRSNDDSADIEDDEISHETNQEDRQRSPSPMQNGKATAKITTNQSYQLLLKKNKKHYGFNSTNKI